METSESRSMNSNVGDPQSTNPNMVHLESTLSNLQRKYSHQPLFLQSVQEMVLSIKDLLLLENDDSYRKAFSLLIEPERTISFRVSWMDDHGVQQVNRGWRVEFNRYCTNYSEYIAKIWKWMLTNKPLHPLLLPLVSSALGPYKGGLRFHPSVDEGILKFLAFEQIFKNALTGLPLGGGKGGSDFDPKGKSDGEIRRFCQSFMTELYRYLHPSTDVPAGDMGVGTREIGYLYGQYKLLTNRHGDGGVLTGKSMTLGGSHLRPEATGYGLVYMSEIALQHQYQRSLQGVRCAISGSGNVAQFTAKKLLELGAVVVTVSDSNGVLVFENGMTRQDWEAVMECKNVQRGRLSSLQDRGRYIPGASPWTLLPDVSYDIALPCATQNEITADYAERFVTYGIKGVLEGANLPTDIQAQQILRQAGILYIPGKASNAGGVGVSGLEMSQNAQLWTWSPGDVDQKLRDMMRHIYDQMTGEQSDHHCTSLEQGANRAAFKKVTKAMQELGWLF
jgi:glutamate dehydrogenase (NADP+)